MFVVANAPGDSDNHKKTFDESPKHLDAVFNDYFWRVLDYSRGDDVLQLCRTDLAAMGRFILKDAPRSSLPALLVTLGVVSLNRLVLPAFYYFSGYRQWDILRPARGSSEKPL